MLQEFFKQLLETFIEVIHLKYISSVIVIHCCLTFSLTSNDSKNTFLFKSKFSSKNLSHSAIFLATCNTILLLRDAN